MPNNFAFKNAGFVAVNNSCAVLGTKKREKELWGGSSLVSFSFFGIFYRPIFLNF